MFSKAIKDIYDHKMATIGHMAFPFFELTPFKSKSSNKLYHMSKSQTKGTLLMSNFAVRNPHHPVILWKRIK